MRLYVKTQCQWTHGQSVCKHYQYNQTFYSQVKDLFKTDDSLHLQKTRQVNFVNDTVTMVINGDFQSEIAVWILQSLNLVPANFTTDHSKNQSRRDGLRLYATKTMLDSIYSTWWPNIAAMLGDVRRC